MSTHEEPKIGVPFLDKIFYDGETNRYGIISLLLIAVGCLGGVAVATGGLLYIWQLALLVASTMFCLAMILAVAPMKAIVYGSIVSMIISIVLIIVNLLVL